MDIVKVLQNGVVNALSDLYQQTVSVGEVSCLVTRKEFEGDFTITVFPFTRFARKKPQEIGEEIGNHLLSHIPQVARFNVIQGFLNLVLSDGYWIDFLSTVQQQELPFGKFPSNGQRVMVEFSSPNTNKPLHLGHIRNILLGWSCSKILESAGYEVIRTQVINNRGIAICKSMLAWKLFGEGKTPASTGIKGDHFVGDYYVLFEKKFQEEYKTWKESSVAKQVFHEKKKTDQTEEDFFVNFKNIYFNEYSSLGAQARETLLKWEANDPETLSLWNTMNSWVYEGFNQTYQALGVSFHKSYYESDTYLLGKEAIEAGLQEGVFYQKPDTSVWIDLTEAKLDHKLVLRSDGTSVYITQDIGMARLRHKEFSAERVVYVVADEQDYHFKVLFEIMKRLGEPYAGGLYHLSYGMVELPSGKMKSREGTVVDADDLISEVVDEARRDSLERGEIATFEAAAQEDVIRKIGMSALKYFILKVHPQKKMIFDPHESVDLQGHTGPYIQYAYVRTYKVTQKAAQDGFKPELPFGYAQLEPQERDLIAKLYEYPKTILDAAEGYEPSILANYCYDLSRLYSKFYHDLSILNVGDDKAKSFRIALNNQVGAVLKHGMDLLGIEMPDRM